MSEEQEIHSDLTIRALRQKIIELEALVQTLQLENERLKDQLAGL